MSVNTPVLTRSRRLAESVASSASAGRSSRWSGTLSLAVWAAYILLVAAGAARHEPWSDEAQAWLLARDAGPSHLFFDLLRSEGSPGLWHAILLLPAKLGLPYFTIQIISVTLGAAAAYLVLQRSPFPLPVKLLLPFSFFLSYQYAVVARNYALLPPLVFGIALTYPQKESRPFRLMVLLALVANVSAQAFLIAGCLAAIHAAGLWRKRKSLGRRKMMQHAGALGGLAVVSGLVVLQLINSRNAHFANKSFRLDPQTFRTISAILLRESFVATGWLTALVVLVSLWWFWRSRVLSLYILPTVVLFVFSSVVYSNAWHEGIPFLIWVLALWVSLQKGRPSSPRWMVGRSPLPESADPGSGPESALDSWSRRAVLAAAFLVFSVQTGWAANAFSHDLREPYSGSRGAASFLKAHDLHQGVVYRMGFPAVALLPYFESNIYDNLNGGRKPSFWDWTSPMTSMIEYSTVLERRPDVVVQAVAVPEWNGLDKALPGYRTVACFPGSLAWKHGPRETEAYLIHVRESAAVLPSLRPRILDPFKRGCPIQQPTRLSLSGSR